MTEGESPTFEFNHDDSFEDEGTAPGGAGVPSETIDLGQLFPEKEHASGSFRLSESREKSFKRLLHSLPIPAMLIDRSNTILFPNQAFGTIYTDSQRLDGEALTFLLSRDKDSARILDLVERVFSRRQPEIWEGALRIDAKKVWVKMHLRPMRMGTEPFVFVLLEDLTRERKRLVRNKKQARDLTKVRDELERRVEDRTHELNETNERLREEIIERKRVERALKKANESLEQRVEERTAELIGTSQHLEEEIEQRRRIENDLQKSKETVEALFNATTDLAFLIDTSGELLAFNQPFTQALHKSPSQLKGKDFRSFFPEDLSDLEDQHFQEVVQSGRATRFEGKLFEQILDHTFYPLADDDGNVDVVAVFARDVTEKRHAEERMNLAAKVIESSNEAVMVTDVNGAIVDVNSAMEKLTGYSRDELLGQNPSMMKSGRHPPEFYGQMWQDLLTKGHWRGEVWDRRKDGVIYPKLLSISVVKNNEGEVSHYVGIFADITSLKETEARLQQLAHFDPLTGLPNRLLFLDRFRQALAESDRNQRLVALLSIDLDGFKNVNDTLGHKAGDELLDAVGKRIALCVRKMDTVARVGGDEFTVVIPETSDTHAAAVVGRKIIHTMAQPFRLSGREVSISASVGITMSPADGTDIERLLRNADIALYHAKESGRNNFKFFSERMNKEVLERLELEAELRDAIARNEFLLYYQPRLTCSTNKVTGVEALLRWNHPRHGLTRPLRFLSIAEETSLIVPIGEWVVRSACNQAREWHNMGLPPVPVAVNISAPELARADFVQTIARVVEEAGLDPKFLELEVPEIVAMQDSDSNTEVFRQLKSLGIRCALDGFGAGYSSLGYLQRLPIEMLKSDASFVANVESNPGDQAVVSATIAVAHDLNMKVTATGVETAGQLQFLQERGCDEWQGHHFCEPGTAEQIVSLIKGE